MARAAPFMLMKYGLSLCSYSHGEEEGGRPSLCAAAQDIVLPLPLRDTSDAPSRGRGTNRGKDYWGNAWSLMYHSDFNPSDPGLISQNIHHY